MSESIFAVAIGFFVFLLSILCLNEMDKNELEEDIKYCYELSIRTDVTFEECMEFIDK